MCPCDKGDDSVTSDDRCRITKDINLVCGVDGKTYDNESHARCQEVEVECDGDCPCHNNDGGHPKAITATAYVGCWLISKC